MTETPIKRQEVEELSQQTKQKAKITKTSTVYYDIAVIDPGYGNFKIGKLDTSSGKWIITTQPSIVSEVPEWQYQSMSGIGVSASVEYKGNKYLVGTLAQSYGLTIPSFSPNWLEELACPLFTLSFCKEVQEVYVLLSPADWGRKEEIKNVLAEVGYLDVKFAPQGIGIWLEAEAPKNSVVIDIGYNTVDIMFTLDGKPIRELCFALKECGLVSFLEKLTKDDPSRLARLLEQGEEELVDKAKRHYFPWLLKKLSVRNEWRQMMKVDVKIYGGGGAYFLPDHEKLKEDVIVPERPEIANVKGFLLYLLKEKRKMIKT
ncbi:MAG: ParM/StbA family protein [Candidatus Diapherotrites archaeon]|nr:ParM/StbA family protein [Candidatus Diapherotrites archaeon]